MWLYGYVAMWLCGFKFSKFQRFKNPKLQNFKVSHHRKRNSEIHNSKFQLVKRWNTYFKSCTISYSQISKNEMFDNMFGISCTALKSGSQRHDILTQNPESSNNAMN